MAGIDNITNEILQEARLQADKLLSEAKAAAEAAENAAAAECGGVIGKAQVKAEQDSKNYADRIASQIGMRQRQAVLAAKQEIIEQVIRSAYDQLASQDDAAYFSMIEKLIAKNVSGGDGEILFSAKDLKRLPKDFAVTADKIAAASGAKLTVSQEAADIADGFILRFGGIEENCTLKALFAEKRDSLQDKVAAVLW